MSSEPQPGLTDLYALVNYIPDPLGRFLDELRREVVPGCKPHAHVTLLPPRRLPNSREAAVEQICRRVERQPGFALEIGAVAVFERTNVLYLEIARGRDLLLQLHQELNRDALAFDEPFHYHPHVTIAQELAAEQVPAAAEIVRRRWAEFSCDRSFEVKEFTFVKSNDCRTWVDLTSCPLAPPFTQGNGRAPLPPLGRLLQSY